MKPDITMDEVVEGLIEGTHVACPREPTEAMEYQGGIAQSRSCGSYGEPKIAYLAMIAAAEGKQE